MRFNSVPSECKGTVSFTTTPLCSKKLSWFWSNFIVRCLNASLWSTIVFEKEVISHSINTKPFFMHLKAHKVMQQGCFFFHYSLATSMTNWAQPFLCKFWDTPSEDTGLWQLTNYFSTRTVKLPWRAADHQIEPMTDRKTNHSINWWSKGWWCWQVWSYDI